MRDNFKDERMGIIYRAHCTVSGKDYIGQTVVGLEKRKSRHLNDAKKASKYHFHNALRKYGEERFVWSIEAVAPEFLLNKVETKFIEVFDSHKNGYNTVAFGGCTRGFEFSDETKKKLSLARMGNSHALGAKHSHEANTKKSVRQQGMGGSLSKLTDNMVREIKTLLKNNIMQRDIAEKYSVHFGTISKIKRGKTWTHITLEEDNGNN